MSQNLCNPLRFGISITSDKRRWWNPVNPLLLLLLAPSSMADQKTKVLYLSKSGSLHGIHASTVPQSSDPNLLKCCPPELWNLLKISSLSLVSRRNTFSPWPTISKLGFGLAGLFSFFGGPLTISMLRPMRYLVLKLLLNLLPMALLRYKPIAMSLSWMQEHYYGTLVQSKSSSSTSIYLIFMLFECMSLIHSKDFDLKTIGIMTPHLRSEGYQYVLNLLTLPHRFSKLNRVLSHNIWEFTMEEKDLRKHGIMVSSPRRGDYRSLPILPLTTEPIHSKTNYFRGTSCIMACVKLNVGLVEIFCSVSGLCGYLSLLCGEFLVLVGSGVLLSRYMYDNGISSSSSLVPIIPAWSSRGLLGSSILYSSEWFEIYPYQGQPNRFSWMPSLLSSHLNSDPVAYWCLKCAPLVPICHLSPLLASMISDTPLEPPFQSSIASFARAVYDHLLVEDFAKPVFMVESALGPIDSSNIVKPSKVENPFEELMEPLSLSSFIYLAVCCMNSPLFEASI